MSAPRRQRIDAELHSSTNNQTYAGRKRARIRAACKTALFAFALVSSQAPAAFAAQKAHKIIKGLDDVYILKSEDRKHAILRAACKSCHSDSEFNFWMLVYGEEEPRVEAEIEKGAHGKTPFGRMAMPGYMEAGRKGTWDHPNSHDYFDCEFCHMGTPSPADDTEATFAMPARDLCAPCHPDTEMFHLYNGGGLTGPVKLEKLLKHGLPTEDGEVLCLTCHQLHNAIFSVRPGYIRAEVAERAVNPHGSKLYCLLCHEGRLDDPVNVTIRKGGDTVALCSGCHGALESESKHHPLEVTFGEETWKLGFINFPFRDGKLSCVTCHDEVCYQPRDLSNPSFLRGGPYTSESEFCYRCHTEDKTEIFNPHKQFLSVGLLKPETCLNCHTSAPDRTGKSAEPIGLIEEVVFLCQKCHGSVPRHPVINHLVAIPGDMLTRKTAYEEKHKVTLPLGESGAIVCTTCHNPHDKGVLKGDMGVGAGEILFLRLPDFREICAPCHGRY